MFRKQSQRRRFTYACSFCGKGQDHVQRLIAGPGGVSVCDECIERIAGEKEEERGEPAEYCSFCGKSSAKTRYIKRSPGQVGICNECIELCQEIIAEEQSTIQQCARPANEAQDNNLH